MNLFFLTAEMAILVNHKVILEHSADESSGVKDHTLLESALKRPQQSLSGAILQREAASENHKGFRRQLF